jgi:oligopeptide transport system permease protein
MGKYIVKRLLVGLVTLFALVTITFFLMHIIPGSPFSGEMSKLPADTKQILIQSYQLDKPLYVQYLTYLGNILHGDFGTSLVHKGTKVLTTIGEGLPYTAKLGGVAFIVALVVGILLGTVSAFSKKKWVQGIAAFVGTIGVSVPSFLFALFLMYVFGVWLKMLPMIGLTGWQNYIMPSIALAISPIAMISRLVRSSLTEEIHQDYITLALGKGTPYAKVIWRHALKNAVIPVITYAGPLLAGLLTGSFVVESMFSIPGIGASFVASVSNRDYTMIMALTILYGSLIIVANILTDLITAMIDPRIRLK